MVVGERAAGSSRGGDAEGAQQRRKKQTAFADCKQLVGEIVRLSAFVSLNQEGFRKIIKKHDKNSPIGFFDTWQWKIRYNPLSKLFPIIKDLRHFYSYENKSVSVSGGDKFERKSLKFWVDNSHIMVVIFMILENLPIYIFDEDVNEGISHTVSSVYFDNDNLDLFHERLARHEGANVLRMRWYGGDCTAPGTNVPLVGGYLSIWLWVRRFAPPES